MQLFSFENLPKIPKLKLAVVGHVEWVTFLTVDRYPQGGLITHGDVYQEQPAGGGAVTAVQIAKLTNSSVHLFTSLGKDSEGEKSYLRLQELGLKTSIAWRDKPTRRGISMLDKRGERAITVIGERLEPNAKDQLPWEELNGYDGVFVSAADTEALTLCRKASVMVATPRIGLIKLKRSGVKLDALIGSALDPDEKLQLLSSQTSANLTIATEGALGGKAWPGGHFEACKLKSKLIDSYGCGDSFAGGVTTRLASGWSTEQAISLGAHCGANCATHLGPYPKLNSD